MLSSLGLAFSGLLCLLALQLKKGSRIGPYEILEPIGAGGMGEVYRARDTRLGRDVAIKVLSREMSVDPKLRLRFEREAKAVSNLNHPNICALHDVGEIREGNAVMQYIVMEYLEGETLESLLKRGPLPLEKFLRYSIEIADALEKAHRNQILHRDLKPANIMITKTGARLFDFGLAKSLHPEPVCVTRELNSQFLNEATTAEKSLTAEGSMIGTLEYMAPEQLRGEEPDARTDVFSFGVCLYQMLTGRRPFQGASRASVIAAILEHEPAPIAHYRSDVPSRLEWLVKNCLNKDRDERIQTAHDVLLDLRQTAGELRRADGLAQRSWSQRRIAWIGLAALAVVVTILAITFSSRLTTTPNKYSVKRFSISLPPGEPIADGRFEQFAVSRDGSRLAYVGGPKQQLFIYSSETQQTRALEDTDGARGPFFSPDGKWIGFYTVSSDLKKVPVSGGTPSALSSGHDLRGATWGPDDTIVFAETRAPLRKMSASGGPIETLLPYDPQENVRWPSFLPGGEFILYTANDFSGDYEKARLVVRSLKTSKAKVVLNGGTCGKYVPSGYLIYFHSDTLYAAPFDIQKMELRGPPVPLINDVDSYFAFGLAHFAVSDDGALFYLPADTIALQRELVWVDRTGATRPVTTQRRHYEDPKLSPDGQRLLITIGPRPRSDLWLFDLGHETWTRITSEATNESGIWSPDGRQIAFASNKNGSFDLYLVSSDLSGPPRQITSRRSWDFPKSWTPDGRAIAVVEQYQATLPDIFVVAPRQGAVPMPLISTRFDEHEAAFSPDGRWIAYQSNQSGRDEIYVEAYPHGGRKSVVSTSGGTTPVWRRDGQELFYRSGNAMMSVQIHTGSEFSAGKPQMLFKGEFDPAYDVSADGQQFLMVKVPKKAPRTEVKVALGLLSER